MLITPVFILLCIIAIMGVIIFGIGICKEDTIILRRRDV